MDNVNDVEKKLDQLDRDGYLLIKGALTPEETEHVRQRINYALTRLGRRSQFSW